MERGEVIAALPEAQRSTHDAGLVRLRSRRYAAIVRSGIVALDAQFTGAFMSAPQCASIAGITGDSYPFLPPTYSNQLESIQADVARTPDDDVVVQFDAQRPRRFDDRACHLDVGA